MFLEVDVTESANCPLSMVRMFDAMEDPKEIGGVVAAGPDGEDRLCRVTGWSSSGPCSAYAVLVEDSGEGVATLVYGGDEGIRLQPWDRSEPWDLSSPHQWGEACLLLDQATRTEPSRA